MLTPRSALLTLLTMIFFAANSLLCRQALRESGIDAASFTLLRLLSGAIVLWGIVRLLRKEGEGGGNWGSALALFTYAAAFSFAYLTLTAATGALLLFGAVQATMIGHALRHGERLQRRQILGLLFALSGLVVLLLPGLAAPSPLGSLLMVTAGIAWGIYSLRGRGAGDPTRETAGNFLRGTLPALLLSLLLSPHRHLDPAGVSYAITSGAIASGVGYALWYAVLPRLQATTAATVQLSVPVLAALGGIVLLGEPLSLRFVVASFAILGGITFVILRRKIALPPADKRN